MSINTPPPGETGRGQGIALPWRSGNRKSPSINAYVRRANARPELRTWNPLTGKTEASIGRLAGLPQQYVDVLQNKPSYDAYMATAEVVGGIETEPPKGSVQTLFEFIDRPRSAMVGSLYGLLGQSRPSNTRGDLDADMAQGKGRDVAARRFTEGITGKDRFFASDFGVIGEKPKKTDSIAARGFNSVAGFVIDTVMDPLTYVSFGGSIMGRKSASVVVQSKARTFLENAISDDAFDSANLLRKAVSSNTYSEAHLVEKIREAIRSVKNVNLGPDVPKRVFENINAQLSLLPGYKKYIEMLPLVGRKIGDNNKLITYDDVFDKLISNSDSLESLLPIVDDWFLRNVALNIVPDVAGFVYAANGSKALRSFLDDAFKNERLTEQFFDALPNDIKGGIRIRVPFYRDSFGVAKSYAIPGIGSGQLSKKSQTIDYLTNLTESARNYIASSSPSRVLLAKFGGQNGEKYYQAVASARGRLNANGTVTFNDYVSMEQGRLLDQRTMAIFDQTKILKYQEIEHRYFRGLEKYSSEEQKQAFDRVVKIHETRRHLTENGKKELREILSSKAIDKDGFDLAQSVGLDIIKILDDTAAEATRVFKDSERAFYAMKYYIGRVMTTDENVRQSIGSNSLSQGGAASFLQKRSKLFDLLSLNEDATGSKVLTWFSAEDANRIAGPEYREIYETKFYDWLPVYLHEVRGAFRDQSLVNFYKKSGILYKVERVIEDSISQHTVLERYRQLFGVEGTEDVGLLVGWRKRLNEFEDKASEYWQQDIPVANRKLYEMMVDDMEFPGVRQRSEMDKYEDISKNPSFRKRIMDKYKRDELFYHNTAKGPSQSRTPVAVALYNENDETIILSNFDKTYSVYDLTNGQNLFRGDAAKEKFSTASAAVEATAYVNGLKRDSAYFEILLDHANKMNYTIDSLLADPNRPYIPRADSGDIPNYDPASPIDASRIIFRMVNGIEGIENPHQHITDTVHKMIEILEKFGRLNGEKIVSDDGAYIVTKQAPVSEKMSTTEEFIKFVRDNELTNIQGVGFESKGKSTVNDVRTRVLMELNDYYGPRMLMESLGRLFEAYKNPNTIASKIYNNYYKPFYQIQKLYMTLGRGPGFAIKNFLGGTFTLHISGASAEHAQFSAKIIAARLKAVKVAQDEFGKDWMRTAPESAANLIETEMMRSLAGLEFRGNNAFDVYKLFVTNGYDASREGASVVGNVLEGARNRVRPPGRLRRGNRIIKQFEEGADLVDVTTKDLIESFLNDNIWIRKMQSYNAQVEDYLRLTAFTMGIDMVGLEPVESGIRGFGASLYMKLSQFDYADLSDFERDIMKNAMPFYVWMRNNVPLQVRNIIHNPRTINQALRAQEELAALFGEPGSSDDYPYASYLNERFSWVLPGRNLDFLPDWIQPEGDLSFGLVWGEPLTDVNRILRMPTSASSGQPGVRLAEIVNLRDFAQNMNPIVSAGSEFTSLRSDPGVEPGATEPAIGWMKWLHFGKKDPNTGDPVVSRAMADMFRNLFPMLGIIERNFPVPFGGERQRNRQLSSLMSSFLGLPVATEDAWKTAGAMQQRINLIKRQTDRRFGENAEWRVRMVSDLLKEGAPLSFIASLNIGALTDEEIDVQSVVSLWRMIDRANNLIEAGVPEEDLIAALSVYIPEGVRVSSVEELLTKYGPRESSDYQLRQRAFGLQDASEEDLAMLGLTTNDIVNMTTEQRMAVIAALDSRVGETW